MQALAKCAVAQRKATGAHFTPPDLAALLGRRLLAQDLAEENGEVRVLDPSCGDGQLLKALYDASPSSLRAKIQLIGVESDALSLECARDVLSVAREDRLVLVQGDFLSLAASPQGELPLFAPSSGTCGLRDPAHVIIANPPYVRTQILGSDQSQRLAADFRISRPHRPLPCLPSRDDKAACARRLIGCNNLQPLSYHQGRTVSPGLPKTRVRDYRNSGPR